MEMKKAWKMMSLMTVGAPFPTVVLHLLFLRMNALLKWRLSLQLRRATNKMWQMLMIMVPPVMMTTMTTLMTTMTETLHREIMVGMEMTATMEMDRTWVAIDLLTMTVLLTMVMPTEGLGGEVEHLKTTDRYKDAVV
jgi:hypothetical protein